ncbi:MAG: MBL fold metallo-hydrolase [Defluviitaleaceae bacterium]|nr:MBL fold metallo-hydrolase [Defluviitaleaceae bacterium]MCL2262956.1 MBL fold metallo-hydrolase [Defluviitaleaceae bacterium]
MDKRKKTAVRAVRRKVRRRRQGGRRGFSFFVAAFCVLLFALVYFFGGDLFFPDAEEPIRIAEGEIMVSFIDVGQGDSIVIYTSYNAVLIDAGDHRNRNAVLDYLNAAGITRLDYVVATHPHADHIGGMPQVLRDFEIGRVLMPDVTNDTDTFEFFLDAILNNDIETHFPSPGEIFTAGTIEMLVIAPPPGQFSGLNDNSIVIRMEHGQTSFLFTGDAERPLEQWMVDNAYHQLRADVLKVGHHGSRTSTTEAFLNAVDPSIAVIQVGGNNRFGHPHDEVMERLYDRDIAIYRTDHHGTVRMITDGQTISIP